MFQYIGNQPPGVNITLMCQAYGVTKSGYYSWRNREESERSKANKSLTNMIKRVHSHSYGIYGSPRVTAVLHRQGVHVSENRVARLMREAQIKGRVHHQKQRAPAILDEIKRTDNKRLVRATPSQRNQVWVGDVTYIRYQKRWWYLAVVMDVFSRKIIGWSLDTHRRQDLTLQALKQALGNRQRTPTMLFHSDRGVEYGASRYRAMLAKHQITPSMNRPGHCTDNAHVESFFHSLKAEWLQCDQYASVSDLRTAIRSYIVNFYNNVRLHSSLGFRSPNEFEREFCH